MIGETGILQRVRVIAWHWPGVKAVACGVVWGLIGWTALGYEIVLPMPSRHFNDSAHVVSAGAATELEQTLEQLEQKASGRVMVVVLKKVESDQTMEEYTTGVAKSWGVGEYRLANSAVLFVFAEPRRAWLQVGAGLEKALPDATVESIIDTIVNPSLAKGEFDTGLRAGVAAIVHQVEAAKPAVAASKPLRREQFRTNEVIGAPPVRAVEVVSATNQAKTVALVPVEAENRPPATNTIAEPPVRTAEVVSAAKQANVVVSIPPVVEGRPPPPVLSATNSVSVSPPAVRDEVVPPSIPSRPIASLPAVVESQPAVPVRAATNEVKEVKPLPDHRPADTVPPAHRAGTAATDAWKGALAAYDNAVIEKVQKRWNAFVERHGSYAKSGKVTVEFQLLEDGSIQGLKTRDETGDQALRLYCEKAVRESAPFSPMSAEMRKLSDHKPRDVEMTFQY